MDAAHRVPCIAVLATLALSACGVERTGLQVSDLGPGIDGGRFDLGTIDLGNVDLGVSDPELGPELLDLGPEILEFGPEIVDLGPPDMGPPDMGPPDMGPPDMGPPDMGPLPSCDATYGTAASYFRCVPSDPATLCEFYSTEGGDSQTCVTRCGAFGGTCRGAYDNANSSGSGRCTRDGSGSCTDEYNDAICICTR